jgi:hypothetical protein
MATQIKRIGSGLKTLVIELFIISVFVGVAKFGPDGLHAATCAVKDLCSMEHASAVTR